MKKLIHTIAIALALILSVQVFAKTGTVTTGVVNINTASLEELVAVPGIGDAKAGAIIDQRKIQPFNNKEDLLAVRGIGEKLLEKISPYVVVTGGTTLKTEKNSETN